MNDLRVWIHGLVAAGISGAATAITVLVVDPKHFSEDAWKYAGVQALINVAFYLKKSPIWGTSPPSES